MDSLMLADSLRIADSLKVDTVYLSYTGQLADNNLAISADWKGGQEYTMSLLPEAVTDMYSRSNDTLSIEFAVKDSSAYDDMTLRITNLADSISYVMELRKDKEVIKKRFINGVSEDSVVYTQMPVGKYIVWLIEDLNTDQKWTTGDYWSQRQPEIIKRFPLQAMQSGFALDATIEWIKNEIEVNDLVPLNDSTTVPSIDPKVPKSKIPDSLPNKGKRGIK